MSGTDVRGLRQWMRTRGIAWSERKCARVIAAVEIELARHRVVARRETLSQMALEDQRADEATVAQGFADLRRMLQEVES